ncbi:type II toxin-antitoxin system RelE/ParE family toxin [Brenneria tiliae]|uniref:type II toxin-antitoxin system RelE/ParE family toxin n=1 Tax=Brenneria tiliae TaxID=2914984 RepID=UPI002014B443|nr:type II toxin-antitoxin system RelE/ParE family toxin [Brenneria tiliae]MCL2898142.1 type II toxin-antitoxin system RelE/ParE family toxin [Brenneria tiliae]MCL2902223.1 type II toxin-antitoxin system RelE/ParE family toxin [Brenneria tiliae]
MRVFKNAWFERFARRQHISDKALLDAIRRAEKGLIDADLGGGVIKQRVARPGQGKSGGFRTIVLYRTEERAFFIYGFAKSDRANIDDDEVTLFKKMAFRVLELSDEHLNQLIGNGQFLEVSHGEEIS